MPTLLNTKKILLVDAIGAFTSGILLGLVLVSLQGYIGMPANVLYTLSAIAFVFAIYSSFSYFFAKNNWREYIKPIAIANLIYCLTTAALTIYFLKQITALGIAYFFGECCIIISLAIIELKVAFQHN